jgi:hypothetical protein
VGRIPESGTWTVSAKLAETGHALWDVNGNADITFISGIDHH